MPHLMRSIRCVSLPSGFAWRGVERENGLDSGGIAGWFGAGSGFSGATDKEEMCCKKGEQNVWDHHLGRGLRARCGRGCDSSSGTKISKNAAVKFLSQHI